MNCSWKMIRVLSSWNLNYTLCFFISKARSLFTLLATMNGGISSSSISFLSSAFGATLVLSMCFLFLRVILETNRFNINTENVSENVFYNVFEDFLKTKLKKNPSVIAQKQTVREVRRGRGRSAKRIHVSTLHYNLGTKH